jgi:hypothetical protein
MIPDCLYNRLIDGGEDVGHTSRLRSTPQKHFFLFLALIFVKRLSKPQGLVQLEGLDKFKKEMQ